MQHSKHWTLLSSTAVALLTATIATGCKNNGGSGSDDGGNSAGGSDGLGPDGNGGVSGENGGADNGDGGSDPDPSTLGGSNAGGADTSALGGANSNGGADSSDDAGTATGGAEPGADGEPLYAMMVQVYGTDDRTVYVPLSHTLDLESVDLDLAREFPGVANFAAIDGRLLISDGTEPIITEFDIGEDFSWTVGRVVSFAAYPLTDNANFYYQFLIDEHTAWMPFDGTSRIIWDPTNMMITGTIEDSMLESAEPTLTLESGGNRNALTYPGDVLQAYYYHDDDWYDYGTQSHIVVYDHETLEETDVLDIPCPGVTLPTRDEEGNTYFGSWGIAAASLFGDQPPPCVVKVSPGSTIVETFDPRDWTDGRFVDNFRYIGDGKAFGNVLHAELLGIDDLSDTDRDAALDAIEASGEHWKLWLFDVEERTGAPVEGIDLNIGSGAQFAVLDGRTFMFAPFDEWSRTRVYELDAEGTATARFDVAGDIFKWVKVR